jgi:hypothetical protein
VYDGELVDGIDFEKKTKLKNKKGINSQSDIERWNAIYFILFPGDDLLKMPSPCKPKNQQHFISSAD